MATLSSVLADIATLSVSDKEILKSHIIKAFSKRPSSLEAFVTDERFSGGLVCPICGCLHVIRNRHRNDTGYGYSRRRHTQETCCAVCVLRLEETPF